MSELCNEKALALKLLPPWPQQPEACGARLTAVLRVDPAHPTSWPWHAPSPPRLGLAGARSDRRPLALHTVLRLHSRTPSVNAARMGDEYSRKRSLELCLALPCSAVFCFGQAGYRAQWACVLLTAMEAAVAP